MKKRILIFVFCMVMMLTMVQITAYAADSEDTLYTEMAAGTVTLEKDVTLSTTLNVTNALTIDLNGYTLSVSGRKVAVAVSDGAALTITDSSASAAGVIYSQRKTAVTVDGATVTVKGGTVESGSVYGIEAVNHSTVTVEGGTVVGASVGIYAEDSIVAVTSGTVGSVDADAGIEVVASIVEISGGAKIMGYDAVAADEESTLTISSDDAGNKPTIEAEGGSQISGDAALEDMTDGVITYDENLYNEDGTKKALAVVEGSMLLDGSIRYKISVDVTDALTKTPAEGKTAYNTTLHITDPNGVVTVKTLTATGAEGVDYSAIYTLYAAQLTDTIKIEVISNDVVWTKELTGADYLNSLKNSENETDATKNLADALLDYGTFVQIYDNYKIENLAKQNAVEPNLDVVAEAVAKKAAKIDDTDKDDKLSFVGSRLVLKDATTLKVYFVADTEVGATIGDVEAEIGTEEIAGTVYNVLTVPNIAPDQLGTDYVFAVTEKKENGKTITLTCSALTYADSVLNPNPESTVTFSEATKNMVGAWYNYHLAAVAYVGQ